MPYIVKEYRERLDPSLVALTQHIQAYLKTANPYLRHKALGQLNYCITKLLWNYIVDSGQRYHSFSDALGTLEAVKLELYRRKASFYEDEKCEDNGDVYVSYPGKAALERDQVKKDIVEMLRGMGRNSSAEMINNDKFTCHVALKWMLSEPDLSEDDKEQLRIALRKAKDCGI